MRIVVVVLALCVAACSPPPTIEHPDTRLLEASVREAIAQARAEFDQRVAAGVDDAAAYAQMGKTYLAHHLTEAAADSFDQARQRAPRDHRWHYYFAVASAELGRDQIAQAAYQQILTLQKDDWLTHYRLGRLLLDRGDAAPAAAHVEAALRAQPTDAAVLALAGELALSQGQYQQADSLFTRALTQQASATRLFHPLVRARRALGADDLAALVARAGDGEARLNDERMQALASYSRSTQMLLEQGSAMLGAGDYAAAARLYERATQQNPDDVFAWSSLGRTREVLGDVAGATAALTRALALDSTSATAHFFLGTLRERQGDDPAAMRAYRAALDSDPGNPRPRLLLAHALLRAARDDEAQTHYDEIAARRPANLIVRYYLTLIHLSRGRCDAAAGRLNEALALKANYGPLLEAQARYRALCVGTPDALRDARETAQLLMQARPDARSAVTMALVLAASGDHVGATAARAQALQLAGDGRFANEIAAHLGAQGQAATAWPVGSVDLLPPPLGPDSLK